MVNILDLAVVSVACIPAEGGLGARLIKFRATGSSQGARLRWGIPPKSQDFENLGRGAGSMAGL